MKIRITPMVYSSLLHAARAFTTLHIVYQVTPLWSPLAALPCVALSLDKGFSVLLTADGKWYVTVVYDYSPIRYTDQPLPFHTFFGISKDSQDGIYFTPTCGSLFVKLGEFFMSWDTSMAKCVRCKLERYNHAGDRCLYEPTTFYNPGYASSEVRL